MKKKRRKCQKSVSFWLTVARRNRISSGYGSFLVGPPIFIFCHEERSKELVMNVIVAEKVSSSAVNLLREPTWNVTTSEQLNGNLAQALESADALIVR